MSIDGGEIIRGEFEPSEPVDLVIYIETERIVVGEAGINADGTFTAQIHPTDDSRVVQILENVRGEFSFGLPRVFKPQFSDIQFTAGDILIDGAAPQQPDDFSFEMDNEG